MRVYNHLEMKKVLTDETTFRLFRKSFLRMPSLHKMLSLGRKEEFPFREL